MAAFTLNNDPKKLEKNINNRSNTILPLSKLIGLEFKRNGKIIDPNQSLLKNGASEAILIHTESPESVFNLTRMYKIESKVIDNKAPNKITLEIKLSTYINFLKQDMSKYGNFTVTYDHKEDEAFIDFTNNLIFVIRKDKINNEYKVEKDTLVVNKEPRICVPVSRADRDSKLLKNIIEKWSTAVSKIVDNINTIEPTEEESELVIDHDANDKPSDVEAPKEDNKDNVVDLPEDGEVIIEHEVSTEEDGILKPDTSSKEVEKSDDNVGAVDENNPTIEHEVIVDDQVLPDDSSKKEEVTEDPKDFESKEDHEVIIDSPSIKDEVNIDPIEKHHIEPTTETNTKSNKDKFKNFKYILMVIFVLLVIGGSLYFL